MRMIHCFVLMALLLFSMGGVQAQTGGGNAGGNSAGVGGGGGGNGGNAGRAATANGTVLRVSGSAFIIVDTSGASITIPTSPATAFLMSKTPGAFQDVVKPGMKIRATAAPDGTAAQVTASGIATSLNTNQLPVFLGVTDQEWAVLKPRIDRIKALKSELSGNGGSGGGGNNANNGNTPAALPAPTELETASQTLASAAFGEVPRQILVDALKKQRDARAKTAADLAAEKGKLIQLLTSRQEALLVAVGILD